MYLLVDVAPAVLIEINGSGNELKTAVQAVAKDRYVSIKLWENELAKLKTGNKVESLECVRPRWAARTESN